MPPSPIRRGTATTIPQAEGGGGVRGVMKGRVFEKVGVNVSTVGGAFAPEFAKTIHGAGRRPAFFATGISLVAHLANPHAPAVHMNTRFLVTTRRWFGGGADLNPPLPSMRRTPTISTPRCAPPATRTRRSATIRATRSGRRSISNPHRGVQRGVGGIFYDHLDADGAAFDPAFAFTRAVGEAFLTSIPRSSAAAATRRSRRTRSGGC